MTRATVLIPTHDHGSSLYFSVRSVLLQSESNVEVFVVGDGVTEETRSAAVDLQAHDPRVFFFDNEKGPRHGEIHRHSALEKATGEIVCYLGDDDLMLPNHIEEMWLALEGVDFVSAMQIWVQPDGAIGVPESDLSSPKHRRDILTGENHVSFGAAAHTLAAYERLRVGWDTTPEGTSTDLHMWQRFLGEDWCRGRSTWRPSTIYFVNPPNRSTAPQERLDALREWSDRIGDPAGLQELENEVLALLAWDRAAARARLMRLRRRFAATERGPG